MVNQNTIPDQKPKVYRRNKKILNLGCPAGRPPGFEVQVWNQTTTGVAT